jgi:hypothetical protein
MFDPASPLRGEASPNYAVYPQRTGVPERIKEVAPEAKLVYLVRDPVQRTVSQYQLHVSTRGEERTLPEALGDLSDPYSTYTCPSFYAMQLDRYLEHFPQDQILVVDQADLRRDRLQTLQQIFAFLGADPAFSSPEFSEEMNTSSEHRSYSKVVALTAWARTTPLQKLPRRLRVFLRKTAMRATSKPLEPPRLDDDLRQRLQELYADDVARLRQLTGKSFPSWSV